MTLAALWNGFAWPPVLSLRNGLVFLLPVIAWNLIFTRRLDLDRFFPGTAPRALLVAESIVRVLVFLLPIVLSADPRSPSFGVGLATYVAGCVVYFASWIVLIASPERSIRRHRFLTLAPAFTPIAFLLGIAMLAGSPIMALASLIFVMLHSLEYILRMS